MPFAEVQRPSIALGLLQAALSGTGIRSKVVYGNFAFAETIGLAAYQAMQYAPTDHLLGEWCFARGLLSGPSEDGAAEREDEYLDLVLDVRCNGFPAQLEQRKELMRWIRAKTAACVNEIAERIVACRPRIVGCSSVFQQHCASLALLKRIRELSPHTVLLMGGANCEGEMGVATLEAFPWVDCVVSGEADGMFAELCRVLLEHGRDADPAALPYGAISRAHFRNASLDVPPRPVLRDMDALPIPDYDDYFEALRASPLADLIEPGLLAESSRGCWWGEKSHCTFCGLNGIGMKYRSKSPERVLSELAELSRRYGTRSFQFVDNILDMSYFKTLLPSLAGVPDKYSLFYETKANLKREQVRVLADAGVRWIQPGIESLDDDVLRLIGKGNSALMNLQLLKWSREFGIDVSWNILCGLPGESDRWYADMAHWLPAIVHLQPPSGLIRVRYDRFSPYHMRPGDFGLDLEPSRAYAYVYPLPKESLMRLAYSFEASGTPGHIHRGIHDEAGHKELQQVLTEWNDLWHAAKPVLEVRDDGARLHVFDTRPCARRPRWTAEALEAEVYRLCDSAQTKAALLAQLSQRSTEEVSLSEAEHAIATLCEAKVLLSLNGKLLSIGVSHADTGSSRRTV
jgi:magnesium-protoporphyrin IX monomethyl ester (oxidative) cyclase